MTQTQKRCLLIAAATFFSALSLPRSSSAQSVYGEWRGLEYFAVSVYLNNNVVDSYSGYTPATLSILYGGDIFMEIGGSPSLPFSDVRGQAGASTTSVALGTTSATGSFFMNAGPGGIDTGNFFVTYQSILPDGQIDVGDHGAVADLTTIDFPDLEPFNRIVTFASFSTAPEPASIVHAALAVLVIAVVAWIRGFRPRRWAGQS